MKRESRSRLVGVIATQADLTKAIRLRNPPDLFELRLDALRHLETARGAALVRLGAPLIITARHPKEGGRNQLSAAARRRLLLRFLDRAAFLDLELRSLGELRAVRQRALAARVGLIVSSHHLDDTPPLEYLRRELKSAAAARPDIFKLATRTDTPAQLERLLGFYRENRGALPIAAMGIGKLGLESRRQIAPLGPALLYGSLSEPTAEGQPSLRQLRRLARAYLK